MLRLGLASFLIVLGLGALFLLGIRHRRRRVARGLHPGLFHEVGESLVRSFTGWRGLLQLLAVGATAALVLSGGDGELQAFFQRHDPLGAALPYVFLVVGNFWHVLAGVGLLALGKARGSRELVGAALASIQAVLLSGWVVLAEKILTGRRGPLSPARAEWLTGPFTRTYDAADFRFDFWAHTFRDGRFFWPSGHTASIVAFASALVAFYPERRGVAVLLYAVAALVGTAMIDGDFHWTSDVVAGALIGHAFGWVVGRAFAERYRVGDAAPGRGGSPAVAGAVDVASRPV